MLNKLFFYFSVYSLFLVTNVFAQSNTEEFNVTMYYPSPSGSYDILRSNAVTVGNTLRSTVTTTTAPNDTTSTVGMVKRMLSDGDLVVSERFFLGTPTSFYGTPPTRTLRLLPLTVYLRDDVLQNEYRGHSQESLRGVSATFVNSANFGLNMGFLGQEKMASGAPNPNRLYPFLQSIWPGGTNSSSQLLLNPDGTPVKINSNEYDADWDARLVIGAEGYTRTFTPGQWTSSFISANPYRCDTTCFSSGKCNVDCTATPWNTMNFPPIAIKAKQGNILATTSGTINLGRIIAESYLISGRLDATDDQYYDNAPGSSGSIYAKHSLQVRNDAWVHRSFYTAWNGSNAPAHFNAVNWNFVIGTTGNVRTFGSITVGGTPAAPVPVPSAGSLRVADTVYSGGADIAEWIKAEKDVDVADVVFVGDNGVVAKTKKAYEQKIAGVISTDPGFVVGEKYKVESSQVLALKGQVPCKVVSENGQIKSGDLLVSSSKPGYAMKLVLLDVASAKDFEDLKKILLENQKRQAAVLGIALESLEKEEGKILILIK